MGQEKTTTDGRIEVFRVPDSTPQPDQAFYTITEQDVGREEIRTTAGVIEFGSGWNDLGSGNWEVQPEDVGRRIYGHPNKGYDGPAWYWTLEP